MSGNGNVVESRAVQTYGQIIGGTNNSVNNPVGKCEDETAPTNEMNNLKGKNKKIVSSHI